jgi:hypothetical protein
MHLNLGILQILLHKKDSLEYLLLFFSSLLASFPSGSEAPEFDVSVNTSQKKRIIAERNKSPKSQQGNGSIYRNGIVDDGYFAKPVLIPKGSIRRDEFERASWDRDVIDPLMLIIENYFSSSFQFPLENEMKSDPSVCICKLNLLRLYFSLFSGRGFEPKKDSRFPSLYFELQDLQGSFELYNEQSKVRNKLELSVFDFFARDEDDFKNASKSVYVDSAPNLKNTHAFNLRIRTIRSKIADEFRIFVFVHPLKVHIKEISRKFIEQLRSVFDRIPMSSPQNQESFIQRFSMDSFHISLDYTNNSTDLNAKQVFRVFPIRDAKLKFQSRNLSGVYGFSKLFEKLHGYWETEANNQKSQIIMGLRPIRTTVNIGTGVLELVILPAQGIHNGESMTGILQGSQSALRKIAFEVFGLAGDILKLTHHAILKVERTVTGNISSNRSALRMRQARESEFPESLNLARDALSQVLEQATENLILIPINEYNSHGLAQSLRSAVFSVPGSLLQGLSGFSEAAALTLRGARNSMTTDRVHISGDR